MNQFIYTFMVFTIIVCVLFFLVYGKNDIQVEISKINELKPLIQQGRIFFWRPQKVGSSTILSILISFSYRYNIINRRKGGQNAFCIKIANCLTAGGLPFDKRQTKIYQREMHNKKYTSSVLETLTTLKEIYAESLPYQIVSAHNICNMRHEIVSAGMTCAFESRNQRNSRLARLDHSLKSIKEIFVVRDPLSRLISIYYFWGELYRLRAVIESGQDPNQHRRKKKKKSALNVRLGQSTNISEIDGKLFRYHGNESTVPPLDMAREFASQLPLSGGMPGPSFTWSAFSDNVKDAIEIIDSDRMISVVTDRLDESLVVARHYLNWTIADVVVTSYRKAQSVHPRHTAWPSDVIDEIKRKLALAGEYEVYNHANIKLDRRIEALGSIGVNVTGEVRLLRAMRSRVTKLCFLEDYLQRYKDYLQSEGLAVHRGNNKLRDTSNELADQGHSFSWNGEILFSFDVCGHCEAHALLLSLGKLNTFDNIEDRVATAVALKDLPPETIAASVHFQKCPKG